MFESSLDNIISKTADGLPPSSSVLSRHLKIIQVTATDGLIDNVAPVFLRVADILKGFIQTLDSGNQISNDDLGAYGTW